jgi:hypothetical protein
VGGSQVRQGKNAVAERGHGDGRPPGVVAGRRQLVTIG